MRAGLERCRGERPEADGLARYPRSGGAAASLMRVSPDRPPLGARRGAAELEMILSEQARAGDPARAARVAVQHRDDAVDQRLDRHPGGVVDPRIEVGEIGENPGLAPARLGGLGVTGWARAHAGPPPDREPVRPRVRRGRHNAIRPSGPSQPVPRGGPRRVPIGGRVGRRPANHCPTARAAGRMSLPNVLRVSSLFTAAHMGLRSPRTTTSNAPRKRADWRICTEM